MIKFLFCLAIVSSTHIITSMQNELNQRYLNDIDDAIRMLVQISAPSVSEQDKNQLKQSVSAKLENLKAVLSQDMRHLPADDPRFGGPVNNKVN